MSTNGNAINGSMNGWNNGINNSWTNGVNNSWSNGVNLNGWTNGQTMDANGHALRVVGIELPR